MELGTEVVNWSDDEERMRVRWSGGGSADGCLTQPSGGDEVGATVGEAVLPGRTRNPSR